MYLDRDYRGKAPKNGVMFVDAPRSDLGQMGKIFSRMKKEIEAQKSIIKFQRKEIHKLEKENTALEKEIFNQTQKISFCATL